jgi:hypothetical protein
MSTIVARLTAVVPRAHVAKDGRIDLHLEGDMSSFLSVRYLNNTETGEITADQEAYIDMPGSSHKFRFLYNKEDTQRNMMTKCPVVRSSCI